MRATVFLNCGRKFVAGDMIALDHNLGGIVDMNDLKERRRKRRRGRQKEEDEWSRNMPREPSRSLILIDRPMCGERGEDRGAALVITR